MVKSIALLLPVYVTLMWGLVFFFGKKSSGKANLVLAAFMLAASFLYFSHIIFFNRFYQLYSFIDSIYILTLLSVYPLFYAYILLLSAQKINISRYKLHFIPGIFLALVSLILTLVLNPIQRIEYVKEVLIARNLKGLDLTTIEGVKGAIFLIARSIFIIHAIVYMVLSIRMANRHNKLITDYYSNTERRSLNWVRNISFIVLFVSMMGISLAIIGRTFFIHHELTLLIPSLLFSTIYFFIGFHANQQLISDELIEIAMEEEQTTNKISQLQEKKLKSRLIALFEKEKIYKNSDLRITTVSESLQTNRTYISRLINEEFGMNFNEFVNLYRIKEAEYFLSHEEHNPYTLEYIAEKSGFGNANSFTRAFKEFKGITPGQFRIICQQNNR